LTENGQPENASQIQNEEHQHDATAKRTVLVDSSGSFFTSTYGMPVEILGGTLYATILNATIEVQLDKDDDSVTCWQPTGSNFNAQITGTVLATVGGTVSVDNFPSGFTNTISGTVNATILGGQLNTTITNTLNATSYQGTDPWITEPSSTFTTSLTATEKSLNVNAYQADDPWNVLGTMSVTGSVSSTITNTLNATAYQGTDPWITGFTTSLSSSFSATQEALNVNILAGDIEVSTVSATILGGTLSVDNFPSGFTNTVTGTVSSTILGGTVTASQGTSPWIINGTITGTVLATVTGTVSVDNFPSTQAVSGTVSNTVLGGTLTNITSTLKATVYQGTDPWNVTANDGAGSLGSTEGTFVVTTASGTKLYSATTDRAGFFVQNQGANDVYFGFTSSVSTTGNYFAKLTSGESADWAFTNTIYTIAATANSTISHGGV